MAIEPFRKRIWHDGRGGVTMIGVLSLSGIIGMTGLAMEAGQGYAQKVENQRIADAAALAAALAYSTASDNNVVLPTARAIVMANGLPATSVAVPLPLRDAQGRTIVTATVTTAVPLFLARVLTRAVSYTVTSVGVAAVTPGGAAPSNGVPGCVIALSTTATTGIAMSGGTSVTTNGCAVNANQSIVLSGGARLTAAQVNSGGSVTYPSGTTITTTPTEKNINQNKAGSAVDPLATSPGIVNALDRANNAASYPAASPVAGPVTPPGGDTWDFSWEGNGPVQPFKTAGGVYSVPASVGANVYKVRRMTVGGGVKVTFNGGTNITISDGLKNEGTVTLGSGGNWKINGGFDTGWNGFSFGTNAWHFGTGSIIINGTPTINGDVVIAGTLTVGGGTDLVFGPGRHAFTAINMTGNSLTLGAGPLNVPGGINMSGGSTMSVGNGDVSIGVLSGTSQSINVQGGAKLYFGDGLFSTSGSIVTAGGTTIVFGATPNHYIKGNLDLSGAATFGAGAYTIYGNFTNTTGCGGCAMTGTDVSFFLRGAVTLGGGSGLNLRAPAANYGDALADILFATRSTAPTLLKEGASNVLSGVWYAPNSAFAMNGGAGLAGTGRCFMLIASTVTLDGGAAASSACASVTGNTTAAASAPATVALIR
jgi:hypothetical protein